MKRKRALFIFGLIFACVGFFLWPFAKENYYTRTIAAMPPAEIEAQIRALNRWTIAPDGTPLRDVENVYGKLETDEINESTKGTARFQFARTVAQIIQSGVSRDFVRPRRKRRDITKRHQPCVR